MRLSDFILLSEEEKKRTVLHDGVLIGKRDLVAYKIFLFQLESFYVEAFCSLQSRIVEEYRAFTNTNQLQPYLPA